MTRRFTSGLAVGLALSAGAVDAPAQTRAGMPLVTPGNPPATVQAGKAFTTRVKAVNRTRRTSRRVSVRFKLAPASGRHVALRRSIAVGSLKPRRSVTKRRRLIVPAGTKAGAYRLVACAKRKGVRAACRFSRRFVRVPVAGGQAPGPGVPAAPGGTTAIVSIASPAEGAENPGRRPAFSGTGLAGGTVTVTIEPGGRTLSAPVAADGTWSVTPDSDLAPGSYTAVAEQPNAGRSPERRFHVAAVMVTAGDIASCSAAATGDDATAALLDANRGDAVAVLGDFVYPSTGYPDASLANFNDCYGPNWGRHRDVSRPVLGNHEYDGQPNAEGYFAYFGNRAGPFPQGWYSYDLGNWHVIALNSNCAGSTTKVSCAADSEQAAWLRADLAANPARCTLAYWHHPRFSSWSETTPRPEVAPLWQILDDAGADLVLTGHAHAYERFAPQSHNGFADPAGIRQFIVGSGGINKHQYNMESPNSESAQNSTFGVLDLTLRASGYDWRFRPVAGGSFEDAGQADCV